MLRKSAGSWLAKGLFGLLILSFGIWGIGDVVRGGGSGDAAITVGEVEVSPYTVRREFDAKVNQMRQMLGDQMTVEFARQAGVMQATVSELIGTATLDMTARDLGVTVSDDGIRQELTQTPAFRDQSGAFNSNQFKAVLAQNGYTEARYVSELRSGLTRARLVNALVGGVAVPSAMSDTLYRYTQEKRTAESLTIHPEALTVDASPTDADLQAIYDAASTDFMAPEYRTIVAVMLSQEAVAQRVAVSEQDIADHYQANRDSYTLPEKRALSQVVTSDQAVAEAVAAAVAAGTPLSDAAAQAGAPAPIVMGALTQDDLPEEMAGPIFALQEGATSEALQSPLGWHVFKVTSITPAQPRKLDEVKDAIAQTLRSERAVDELYKESADLEDMLGGGATLEEAAAKMNLPLVTLKGIDLDGKTADGTAAAALPAGDAGAKILESGFANALNQDSRLQTYDGGYLITRTDEVVDPAPRPLESVRDELVSRWTASKQAEQAQALANELTAKAAQVSSLEELANAPAVTYAKHSAVTRDGQAIDSSLPTLGGPMVARLFTLTEGAVAAGKVAAGQQVIHLLDITAADPSQDPAAVDALKGSLAQAIGQDMMQEATNALSARFGVKVNQNAIDATF
jgi:peptidyl-prolyl cis-trans isomerase D